MSQRRNVLSRLSAFDNLIPVERRPAWQKFYARATESQIFKFWKDQFGEGLGELIVDPFNSFLKMGLAQKPVLSLEPVKWAKTLAQNLLYSLEWTLPTKIKEMCDEQKHRDDFASEHFLAYCAWVYWRAPRLIHMQPSGNTPYNPETAWEREDEDKTERLLHALVERILDTAWFKLDDLAGEAYVSLASVYQVRCDRPKSSIKVPARRMPTTGALSSYRKSQVARTARRSLLRKRTCPITSIKRG